MDMVNTGMREREATLILKLNERAKIKIITPHGETDEIEEERIVKQGTIFGPLLCCGSTKSVNEIGEDQPKTIITNTLDMGALIYVDDIAASGSRQTVERVGENMAEMERKKGFTFSTDKSNTLIIGKEKGKEEMNIQIKKGKIETTIEYRYLGNWLDETGKVMQKT